MGGVDKPGWMEADTVAHGGGSSSGEFMNTLTFTPGGQSSQPCGLKPVEKFAKV